MSDAEIFNGRRIMKIGIITYYYGSTNYGAVLQSYAFCRVLKEMHYDAEQICYDGSPNNYLEDVTYAQRIVRKLKKCLLHPLQAFPTVFRHLYQMWVRHNVQKRKEVFSHFRNEKISHSIIVYKNDAIKKANSFYDIFITGSDQVWNLDGFKKAFFLYFAEQGKIKMSYAASISKLSLNEEEKQIFRDYVNDYFAISVREKSAVNLLSGVVDNVEWCLDPTLLLSSENWDEIASERVESERYVLGFFISGDKKFRKRAKHYAKEKGLKYIEIPFYEKNFHFRDKRMYGVGPAEFISLIKYADFVFTDSFHASVFSILYERQFFAFVRNDHPGMVSRLKDLTALFDCEDRVCDTQEKQTTKYFDGLGSGNLVYKKEKYNIMKDKSIAFLKKNLTKAFEILKDED